jgi:thymidylate kinase
MERLEHFFALEGLDGVGKSTVIRGLEARGIKTVKTPTPELTPLRPYFDKQDTPIRFAYFLLGVLHAGHKAQTNPGETVVCDRYLLTTVSAHEAMGLSSKVFDAWMPVIKSIPVPVVTFVLTATEDTRLARLYNRPEGANENDLANFKYNGKILDGYLKWGRRLGHPVLQVDTTRMNEEEVVSYVANIINQ